MKPEKFSRKRTASVVNNNDEANKYSTRLRGRSVRSVSPVRQNRDTSNSDMQEHNSLRNLAYASADSFKDKNVIDKPITTRSGLTLSHDNSFNTLNNKKNDKGSDDVIDNILSAFHNSLSLLETINDKQSSSVEETTDNEYSHSNKKNVRFLEPIKPDEISYKIYMKGLAARNGTYYGISIQRLESSNKHRKNWPYDMAVSDKILETKTKDDIYYQYPERVQGHYSHALPNCLHGTETPANAVWTTKATQSSKFIGQGDAQGFIEEELLKMHNRKQELDKKLVYINQSPDLRWKSSDAFSKQGDFLYRRIKIYAADTATANQNEENKNIYPEIMLGEFFLPGQLAVSRDSVLVGQLKSRISMMSKNYSEILNLSEKNNSKERDHTFWKDNGFTVRTVKFDGIKTERSHPLKKYNELEDEDKQLFEQSEPLAFQEKYAKELFFYKKQRDDSLLNPKIIKIMNHKKQEIDDLITDIADNINNQDKALLDIIKENNNSFFKKIASFQEDNQSHYDMDKKINEDQEILKGTHGFFKDLIDKNIVENKNIKLLANHMLLKKPNAHINVSYTPVIGWLFAILRIAKKIK